MAYKKDPEKFIAGMEQCYLKILLEILKIPKKLQEKFENLTQRLFEFVAKEKEPKEK
jgi:hypothetical protein